MSYISALMYRHLPNSIRISNPYKKGLLNSPFTIQIYLLSSYQAANFHSPVAILQTKSRFGCSLNPHSELFIPISF